MNCGMPILSPVRFVTPCRIAGKEPKLHAVNGNLLQTRRKPPSGPIIGPAACCPVSDSDSSATAAKARIADAS